MPIAPVTNAAGLQGFVQGQLDMRASVSSLVKQTVISFIRMILKQENHHNSIPLQTLTKRRQTLTNNDGKITKTGA